MKSRIQIKNKAMNSDHAFMGAWPILEKGKDLIAFKLACRHSDDTAMFYMEPSETKRIITRLQQSVDAIEKSNAEKQT